jgi:hypothetical protein
MTQTWELFTENEQYPEINIEELKNLKTYILKQKIKKVKKKTK